MFILVSIASAFCELENLVETLDRVDASFPGPKAGFEELREPFQEKVDCLQAPIDRKNAARVHRSRALYSLLDGDEATARLQLSRYRSLDPAASLESALAPPTHRVRTLFDAADVVPDLTALPPPKSGWLLIDGEQSDEAPTNLPFMLQHLSDDGSVQMSFLVETGAELPGYERRETQSPPTVKRQPTRSPFTIAGVAVTALGLVNYGSAFVTRGAYRNARDDRDLDRMKRTKTATNTLTVSGLLLAGTGGALVAMGEF